MFCFPNKPIRVYNVPFWIKSIDLDKWIVQPKWNGHRALPACEANGRVTVYNRQGGVLALAASNFEWLGELNLPRPWALDAELLRDGRMIIWDYSVLDGNLQIKEPYKNRLAFLQQLKKISNGKHSIEVIETLPAIHYKNIMARKGEKELEGLVFKLHSAIDLWGPYCTSEVGSQFKFRF